MCDRRGGAVNEGCGHHQLHSLWATSLFWRGKEGREKTRHLLQNWVHLTLPIQPLCCFSPVAVAEPEGTGFPAPREESEGRPARRRMNNEEDTRAGPGRSSTLTVSSRPPSSSPTALLAPWGPTDHTVFTEKVTTYLTAQCCWCFGTQHKKLLFQAFPGKWQLQSRTGFLIYLSSNRQTTSARAHHKKYRQCTSPCKTVGREAILIS